jgi:hypothetical protein
MHIHRSVPGLAAAIVVVALAGCGGTGEGGSADAPARVPVAAAQVAAPSAVVPRLIGRRVTIAHRLARRAGFSLRWMGFAGRLANGRYIVPCVKVLRQSPAAGERRARGGQIAVIEVACHVPQNKVHDAFH